MMLGNALIDQRVEALCEQGCRAVRAYIEALRVDEDLPEFAGLDAGERGQLRAELETIMAAYGDVCRP
jgi:hypothetical protein